MVCLQALILAGLLAQDSAAKPTAEDFEDRKTLNVVYDGWDAVVRPPEFPAYNRVSLGTDSSTSQPGGSFIRFRVYGQNTGFEMSPRAAWRIQDPTRSFRFTGWIRLSGTRRNKAFYSIRWLDRAFRALREDHSPALDRPSGWTQVALDIPDIPARTAFAMVRLICGGADVRGMCDFDAIELSSRPRITFERLMDRTDGAVTPKFRISASGFPSGAHTIEVASRDLMGKSGGAAGPISITSGRPVEVRLPEHAPGYYEIFLTLSGPRSELERRTWPLAIPNAWQFQPRTRGWIGATYNPWGTRYREAQWISDLAGFTDSRVILWDRGAIGRADVPQAPEMIALVQDVSRVPRMLVTGVLAAPPAQLFPGLDPAILEREPRALFQLNDALWDKPFRDTILRYWELVPRWELKGEGEAADAVAALKSVSSRAIVVPKSPPSLVVPPLDPGRSGARNQVRDLLQNLVRLRATQPSAEMRYAPLESSSPGTLLDREGYPRAPLLALRAVNDALAGATPRPDLNLNDPRLRDFAFQKDGRLIIAVWSLNGIVEKEFNLGQNTRIYPPLGAVRELPQGQPVLVSSMPAFILDADPFFLQVQQSVHFSDPGDAAAPATGLPQQVNSIPRQIRFRNLFEDEEITNVRMTLRAPRNWVMRPLEFRTDSIKGGEEFSGDLTFVLPPTQPEGSREIPIDLSFNRAGTPYSVTIARTIRVIPMISIQESVTSVPDDPGARRVTLTVTNTADRPANLAARVRLPGLPEQAVIYGRVEARATAPLRLQYVLRGVDLLPPSRRTGSIFVEERGGTRLHAQHRFPLD